jgi:hypothetical protein
MVNSAVDCKLRAVLRRDAQRATGRGALGVNAPCWWRTHSWNPNRKLYERLSPERNREGRTSGIV